MSTPTRHIFVTVILVIRSFVGSSESELEGCQYSFNVWEPNGNMMERMQNLEIKYGNFSNYIDKELLSVKFSSLSDVQRYQNWTANLERLFTDFKIDQVKKYSEVKTMQEQLHRYDSVLKEFGSKFDDFVFHYTNPRSIRRKHVRKDRTLPTSQSDNPGTFLIGTLKNMVSDLKSEWILMKRDILEMKRENIEIKQVQTELNSQTIKDVQTKILNDVSNFKSNLENVKQDLTGLKATQDTLRSDVLMAVNNISALEATTINIKHSIFDMRSERDYQRKSSSLSLPSDQRKNGRQLASLTNAYYDKEFIPQDCSDIAKQGYITSGVYQIRPAKHMLFDNVYCEIVNRTGYTVLQRRTDGLQTFNRGWLEYRGGFGNLYGNFWLGNEIIHILTQEHKYGLRIDMWDWEGNKTFAEYENFSVGDEESKYQLQVGGFSGNAGDSLSYHDGMKFSTEDSDNDLSVRNCAADFKGGWWYREGYFSQLNGIYHVGIYSAAQSTFPDGIIWYTLKNSERYSLRKVEMKLRRHV